MTQARIQKSLYEKYKDVMPTGAGALFLIQVFSTLGFSVIYSTLILYATKALHMSDLLATSITGSFVALNYFLHLLGGYIGGRYLTYRSLFSIGMMLQFIGCLLISIPQVSYLLWGLSAFLAGSGLNAICLNCMVTQLFEPNDKRRESAFLWNYSGMNIGFFIGFSIGGYFDLHHNYHELFLLSALGNLVAFLLTLHNWPLLKDRATSFANLAVTTKTRERMIGICMIIALFFSLRFLLQHTTFCNEIIIVLGASMLFVLMKLALQQPTQAARNKMWGYIVLALASVIFWTLYQIAPMGLNLFIERNVDRHFFGFLIAPQWVQNINTIVIILGGPLLSFIFTHMRERGININIPFQFSLALVLIGIGFAILPMGISLADANGYVNFNWIIISYILQSVGELFISPIGYAMVGELAPLHLRGLMMGTWMMLTGIAATLSNYFSNMALGTTLSVDPLSTNAGYSHTFGMVGWVSIFAGGFLFVCIPLVARLTQERKSTAPLMELTDQLAG